MPAMCGRQSEIQAPLWPCCLNWLRTPRSFGFSLANVLMKAKRLPARYESGIGWPLSFCSCGFSFSKANSTDARSVANSCFNSFCTAWVTTSVTSPAISSQARTSPSPNAFASEKYNSTAPAILPSR